MRHPTSLVQQTRLFANLYEAFGHHGTAELLREVAQVMEDGGVGLDQHPWDAIEPTKAIRREDVERLP